jgi:hypothetical protein
MSFSSDLQTGMAEMKAVLDIMGDGDCQPLVDEVFGPFLDMPEPGEFAAPMQGLADGMAPISSGEQPVGRGGFIPENPGLKAMVEVGDSVLPWHGEAADAFTTNFANPFPAVVNNQFLVALAIENALAAEAKIWEAAQKDVFELMSKTFAALDESDDSFGDAVTAVLTVAAAVVPLAGAATIGAVELITAAASLGAAHESFEIGGDMPIFVMLRALEGSKQLRREITTQERKVSTCMDGVAAAVRADRDKYQSPAPQLVTIPEGDLDGPGGFTPGS